MFLMLYAGFYGSSEGKESASNAGDPSSIPKPGRSPGKGIGYPHQSIKSEIVKSIIVNKRVQNAVPGCNLKNDRMNSVHIQGKPFIIMVIQVYAPTSNIEEPEVEQFYEDLQDLLELTPKKDVLFIIGDWNGNVGSQGGMGWGTHANP